MYHRLSTRSNKQYRACPFKHDLLFVTLFQMLIDEHRKHKFAYICLWGLSSERLKVGFGQDSCTNSFKERVIHAASLLQRLNFSSVNMGHTYLLGWNLKGCDLYDPNVPLELYRITSKVENKETCIWTLFFCCVVGITIMIQQVKVICKVASIFLFIMVLAFCLSSG